MLYITSTDMTENALSAWRCFSIHGIAHCLPKNTAETASKSQLTQWAKKDNKMQISSSLTCSYPVCFGCKLVLG